MEEKKDEEDAGFSSEEGDEVEYNCVDGYMPLCLDEERDEMTLGRPASRSDHDTSENTGGVDEPEAIANGSSESQASSEMSEAQVDLIKSAMAGFSLPSSVTPDWAKLIPEEVWKKQLQTGLSIRQVPPIPPIRNYEAKKKDKS
jgi:hypothetical protein